MKGGEKSISLTAKVRTKVGGRVVYIRNCLLSSVLLFFHAVAVAAKRT